MPFSCSRSMTSSSQSKSYSPGRGLEQRPREDAERDDVDAGLLHQAHVLVPDLARPLLGVVVGAEREPATLGPHGRMAATAAHTRTDVNRVRTLTNLLDGRS